MPTRIFCILLVFLGGIYHAHAAGEKKVNGMYYRLTINNTACILGGEIESETFTIPSSVEIDGTSYPVTQIGGSYYFPKKEKIQKTLWGDKVRKIIVPNSVKTINDGAFQGQTSLEEIVIPTSVEGRIGSYAFWKCTSLKSVTLPEGITEMGVNVFDGCASLQEVILPQSLQMISFQAFKDCPNLKKLDIPSGITQLSENAFQWCGAEYLDFSKNHIEDFNLDCLYGTYAMYIAFPQGIKNIHGFHRLDFSKQIISMDFSTVQLIASKEYSDQQTYHLLATIQELILRSSEPLEKIKYDGFIKWFPNVKTLTVTGEVQTIGKGFFETAYQGIGMLEAVYLNGYDITHPQNGEKISHIAGCKVKHIGQDAFRGQKNLKTIYLPNTLESIGQSAFYGCSNLESIEFPNNLTYIGSCAFWECNLKEITGLNSNIQYDLFQGSTFSHPFMGNPFNFDELQKKFSYFALGYINKDLKEWQQKKEFETTNQWQQRVTVENRDKRVKTLISEAKKAFISQAGYPRLDITLGNYDADYHTYPLDMGELGKIHIQVPLNEAPSFKQNFGEAQISPTLGVKDDHLAVVALEIKLNGKTYNSMAPAPDNEGTLLAQLPPLSVDFQNGSPETTSKEPIKSFSSDVDTNIPECASISSNIFALIIGNENYQHEAAVPFALNDAGIFAEYCHKTLGIPEKNIRLLKDATLNNMKFQLNWLSQILTAYNGEAKAIIYYAGHGIPDEKQQSAYLLPVDGYGSDVTTGYALKDLYATLNNAPSENITVFLDACFSGAKRESGMMSAARGVAIKVKSSSPQGNTVVFTASQGDETAYQYEEKGHGMFTYFLLKKLQDSKGNVTLGELGTYITGEVKRASLLNNDKIQTPTVIPASGLTGWQTRTLK